jgi:hypothetical protein
MGQESRLHCSYMSKSVRPYAARTRTGTHEGHQLVGLGRITPATWTRMCRFMVSSREMINSCLDDARCRGLTNDSEPFISNALGNGYPPVRGTGKDQLRGMA